MNVVDSFHPLLVYAPRCGWMLWMRFISCPARRCYYLPASVSFIGRWLFICILHIWRPPVGISVLQRCVYALWFDWCIQLATSMEWFDLELLCIVHLSRIFIGWICGCEIVYNRRACNCLYWLPRIWPWTCTKCRVGGDVCSVFHYCCAHCAVAVFDFDNSWIYQLGVVGALSISSQCLGSHTYLLDFRVTSWNQAGCTEQCPSTILNKRIKKCKYSLLTLTWIRICKKNRIS